MLETVLYVVGIIAFTLVTIDSVIDFVKDFKKKKEDNDELERIWNKIEEFDTHLDEHDTWLNEIDCPLIWEQINSHQVSIENLGTRTQELDEMIRWYAGELKEEELKDWTYIQPDGSVKISSLKEEVKHKAETENAEDDEAVFSVYDVLCDEDEESQSE